MRTNKSKENQQFKAQRTSANDRTDTAWYRMYQYSRPLPFSPQTTAPLHHSCVPIFSSPTDTRHWCPQNTSSLLCLSCSGAHPVLPACPFVSGETPWLSILGGPPGGLSSSGMPTATARRGTRCSLRLAAFSQNCLGSP